jgi:hypothetical protein
MDARLRLLLEVFDQAYTAPSWHGTPLKGALRGVTPRDALWRPAAGRHCIWDLVLHAAYWKYIVRGRLLDDPAIAFPRAPANFPAVPARPNAAAWRADRALLDEQHALLRQAIVRLDPARLERRSKAERAKWRAKQEIYGIASHDLYHAGQIQLLKRLHGK